MSAFQVAIGVAIASLAVAVAVAVGPSVDRWINRRRDVPRIKLGDLVDVTSGDEVIARLRLTRIDYTLHGAATAELTDLAREREHRENMAMISEINGATDQLTTLRDILLRRRGQRQED